MSSPYQQPNDPNQPAAQSFPQYAPPHAKKRKWPAIVIGVVAFVAVMSAFSDKDDTKQGPKPSAALAAPAPAKENTPTAGLNTPVRDGKFEFVVKTVQPGLTEIGDNPYLREKAQGQFVIVTLSVQNIGDRAQGFSPSNQKLIDTQGRSFESDSSAQIALGDSDIPVWDDINPGNAVDVSLVYDMPAGAAPARIELHDSMFSGGVTVALTP
ncbi:MULTISPECIES: DUF4352 domain-containing protein [Mycobacterium]|uniref:Mpr protein n=1 Tax=Mycobacterium syngnathidarum TaxID=1908205 RepID=A0A1S1JU72_9MYCO|nr:MULTISPECIES: DUF4352 domain-containing protein [Mycobacterium]MCG7607961.1 DUF4352 domain-containing protein [Mycobacterium sp. CnD-18-1]OHT90638.1 Mpr protein [Mycobacterium syngnathidarum]OLT88107.1 Mpr protein [Mycobacterium syngnathidarum]TMS48178.1 DUF4352 domain-containing protein [Mycobacterium sp. DBP42]